MMRKVKWGIISTSNFAKKQIIPALHKTEYSEVAAIASRELSVAKAVADELNIPKAYGSYEELLKDPELNVIYNPLPNHKHIEWSIKALEAGKHVLCEKPIGLNSKEAEELYKASKKYPQLKLMEGFMYRHHPQWQKAKSLVGEGKIGELKTVQCFFSYNNPDPGNIRNIAEAGGGGMLDIGCYCISQSRFIFGREPLRAIGILEYDPALKTDRLASGMLDFGMGTATFTCSTQLMPYQRVNILGKEGRIEIEIPFNAPPDQPTRIWHETKDGKKEITFDICNQYTIQGDLFSKAILNNTPVPTPIDDALHNMKAIDAVTRSSASGCWEKI